MMTALNAQTPRKASPAATAMRSLTVITKPNASVWIDGVLFGTADETGRLAIKGVPAGRRSVRVRLDGFKEVLHSLPPAAKHEIAVDLVEKSDAAETAFQNAERLTHSDRQKAIAAYEETLRIRRAYPEAMLGLARVLSDSGDYERALKVLADLKRIKPRFAEASAVEGRVYKELDDEKNAVTAFKRAIAEGGGYQPEAYAGLGLLYKEKAEDAGSADPSGETAAYGEATRYLAVAVKQLGTAPDAIVIYQLLGLIYERQKKFDAAIALYRDFLKLFPDSPEATAVRSFITQIEKQLAQPE